MTAPVATPDVGADERVADQVTGDGGPASPFDPLAYLQSSAEERKSVRGFFGLTRRSLRLARQASPRVFWINLSLSFFSAGLLLVQVVLGKLILDELLANHHSPSLAAILPLVIALAATTALSGLATSSSSSCNAYSVRKSSVSPGMALSGSRRTCRWRRSNIRSSSTHCSESRQTPCSAR